MSTIDEVAASLDHEFVGEWSVRYLAAWNALDANTVASLCTDDVVWKDPAAPVPIVGRDGVHEFVRTTATAFPDFHVAETAPPCALPGQAIVLSPYRMTGTMLGPMERFAPTGATLSVEGVDKWTFRGELLCALTTYYDSLEVARQLGIMPPVGSGVERMMIRLQHVQARIQRGRNGRT